MTGFVVCNLFMTILYHSNVIVSIACITNKKIEFFYLTNILRCNYNGSCDIIYYINLYKGDYYDL